MKKITVAAYYRLAEGSESTLGYTAPNMVKITAINVCLENTPAENQVQAALGQFEAKKQILVFADLLGGSVNQTFTKFLDRCNIQSVAGVNLPILMALALAIGSNDLSETTIRQAIEKSQQQIIYINDLLRVSAMGDTGE